MDKQTTNKWIICRICLKTSENEMLPIFAVGATSENLVEQIAEYGAITLSDVKTLPDQICDKCLLLLTAARKFRTLCQRSAQQWQELFQLSEEVLIENYETVPPLKLNSSDCKKATTGEKNFDDSPTPLEQPGKEDTDAVVGYALEAIENVEDEDEKDANILDSNDCEYIELSDDRMIFMEDTSTGNSCELSYYPNTQFEVLKHEDGISSDGHIGKFLYDEPKTELQTTQGTTECEIEVNTEIVALKTQVTRGRKKLITARKTPQKRKIKSETGPAKGCTRKETTNNYVCSYCGNFYSEKAKLTLHLKIHTKEKPHECEICHKRFTQTPQLARHMNSHTGSRPFKCKFCEASFADPSTCIKHQRIHTQERPYVCDICGKAFSYSNVLKVHVMTHTGEKPFGCKYCGKKFAQAHHRRTHESTHR